MTNDNNIKRIIQLYFGKHFSRSGRVLFGRWLRAEGEASEKSDMLQAFWEHLPAEATAETREDWDALQRHLQVEPVRRAQRCTAGFALVAISLFIAAMRASPGYIAVGKKLFRFFVIILFACFLDKLSFIV